MKVVPQQTILRLESVDSYTTGSGRTEIWRTLLNSFDARWLIGHGVGSTVAYFNETIGNATGVHNSFLLALYESGLIGFSLFIFSFLSLLIYHIKKKNALFVALIIGAMVSSLFLDTLNLRYLWNALILGVVEYNRTSFDQGLDSIEIRVKYRYIRSNI